jgi:DNA polymerase III alpha subunit (gram-positive type)
MTDQREIFVSVDVETAGPIPGEYSLLAIGACAVYEPRLTFSSELKPINRNADPKALEVTGLSLAPADAMRSFARWLDSLREGDGLLVFVGFNAPFDWSFVNYYFHTFHGSNPFGFAALDIKSYYMGQSNTTWSETTSSKMAAILRPQTVGDHDPLHDAIYQAELFRLVRQRA